jgi:hypothetical protein
VRAFPGQKHAIARAFWTKYDQNYGLVSHASVHNFSQFLRYSLLVYICRWALRDERYRTEPDFGRKMAQSDSHIMSDIGLYLLLISALLLFMSKS